MVFAGTKRLRRRSAPILEYTFFYMIFICSLKDNLLSKHIPRTVIGRILNCIVCIEAEGRNGDGLVYVVHKDIK